MNGVRHWWWQRPFLYIGRMAEDKGVTTIIRAWKALKSYHQKNCPPLWLAGGMPEEIDKIRIEAGLQGPIDTHEQECLIHWWGYLDSPGLSALLSRACVLIMHSRYEPGGRVVIEAMSQGVPVIATPHGFAKDLVRDWYNGFLVDFGDEDTLILRMSHFIHQPLLRNSLGAEARDTARGALNQWRFIDTHCVVYDQAIEQYHEDFALQTVHSKKETRGHWKGRRILPTYPYTHHEPDTKAVISFAEKNIGCQITYVYRIENERGSSTRWRLECGGVEWIVKWPYPRLVLRVLWDPFCVDRLLTPAEERFSRELFSGTLPPFLPWTANDPDNLLLLRPVYVAQPATIDPDVFINIAERYRLLNRIPLPQFSWTFELERDWSITGMEEITELQRLIRNDLAMTPWDPYRHVSVRLAWRKMELTLKQISNSSKPYSLLKYREHIQIFRKLAEAEAGLTLCACHGSGDLAHCLRTPDGQLFFIDGEHVHPAQPGEDMAATIYYAIEDAGKIDCEKELLPKLLEFVAVDQNEINLLLAWMGLLTLEDLCMQMVKLGRNSFELIARWETIARLAEDQLNR